MSSPFSLYLHIPYCKHKCPYCDFNTYAVSKIPEKEYVAALITELKHYSSSPAWQGRSIQSIYFGGGTPSIFSVDSINQLISAIFAGFPVLAQSEITLEANPCTVTQEILAGYKNSGINRISFGVQSFNAEVLKTLGRTHSPEQAQESFALAREAGFNNINLDCIFGVPGQDLNSLSEDLDKYLSINPEHISAYTLTYEKGTPFYTLYSQGRFSKKHDDETAEMLSLVWEKLSSKYEHYEISNFAKPEYFSKHNLSYWEGLDYLGLGAGAHSFSTLENLYGKRWSNLAKPESYIAAVQNSGTAQGWQDTLNKESAIFEFFFLGLRKISGVKKAEFFQKFGSFPESLYARQLEELAKLSLIIDSKTELKLSAKGLMLADSVFEKFIL